MNMHVAANIYGDDKAMSALLMERSWNLCIIQKNNSCYPKSFRDYENISGIVDFFRNEFSMATVHGEANSLGNTCTVNLARNNKKEDSFRHPPEIREEFSYLELFSKQIQN